MNCISGKTEVPSIIAQRKGVFVLGNLFPFGAYYFIQNGIHCMEMSFLNDWYALPLSIDSEAIPTQSVQEVSG